MPNRPRFSAGEIASMRDASRIGHTAWDNNPRLDSLKQKLKEFGKLKTSHHCCYCMRDLYGEFNMVLDIEHILPKSKFPKFMFTGRNLAVSCKRCNMFIKKSRIDFLVPPLVVGRERVFKSRYYQFIHPNLDNYEAHLLRSAVHAGRKVIVKYRVVSGSAKGRFTYDYFKLEYLERNSFDSAQGGRGRPEIRNAIIESDFNALVESMLYGR